MMLLWMVMPVFLATYSQAWCPFLVIPTILPSSARYPPLRTCNPTVGSARHQIPEDGESMRGKIKNSMRRPNPSTSRTNRPRRPYQGSRNDPLESLNQNLYSLANNPKIGSARIAQELLERMEALHEAGYYAVAPDVSSYNAVLLAHAKEAKQDAKAPQRAVALLMDAMANKPHIETNIMTMNTLILSFSKQGMADEAEQILRSMKAKFNVQPDTISYNSVLYALAKASRADKAEKILREMIQISSITANTAKAQEGQSSSSVKPDSISFNTALFALSRSSQPDAAARAEALLWVMESMFQAGNPDVEPDVVSFSTVMNAWAKQSALGNEPSKKVLSKIQRLISMMKDLATEDERQHLQPNCITYSMYLQALAGSGHGSGIAGQRIVNHLWEMYNETGNAELKPDAPLYNLLIACHGNERTEESAEHALDVFREMEDLSVHHPELAPTAQTYMSLFKALHPLENASEVAESILFAMEEAQDLQAASQQSMCCVAPDVMHYNVVLDIIASAQMDPDKAQRARRLVEEHMKPRGIVPSLITFNSLLKACANVALSREMGGSALDIGMQYFQEAYRDQGLKPDSITFVFLFKMIRRFTAGDRQRRLFQSALDYCCKAGLLDDLVLNQLRLAHDSETEVYDLLRVPPSKKKSIRAKDLPPEWSCYAANPKRG